MSRGEHFKNRDVVGGAPPALALATPTLAHCDHPGCAQAFVTGTLEEDL